MLRTKIFITSTAVVAFMIVASCGSPKAPAPTAAVTPVASPPAPPTMKMTTEIPAQITTPDSVETRLGTLKFFDGFPDDATVQKVYDNLDFQRGVQAFLTAMPGASVFGLRTGLKSQGADNQTVLIMEDLMDSKSLFLTPNTETVYNLMWLDLKEGPLVIERSSTRSTRMTSTSMKR
jgi:hypothetical protein